MTDPEKIWNEKCKMYSTLEDKLMNDSALPKWIDIKPSDEQEELPQIFSTEPYVFPPPKATCDLFGQGSIIINYEENSRIPNRWIRFWARVFFNTKWTLHEDNQK